MRASVELTYRGFGSSGKPVIILHGLFGSAANWTSIARRLADRYRVIAANLRNHGGSPYATTMSYHDMAADVRALMDRLGLSQVTLIGHSLGGKVAMQLALETPERVSMLVVVDIAPVSYRHNYSSILRAMERLDLSQIRRRTDADAELRRSIADDGLRLFLLHNLVTTEGGFRWQVNLDAIGKEMAALVSFPSDTVDRYEGPTLFLSGEYSDYITPAHLHLIRRLFPHARVQTIAGSSHWLHVEQPETFLARVGGFLSSTDS